MASAKNEEAEDAALQDYWYLVDTHGQKFRLPKTMLFLGREECDIVIMSQSVDKRHAVLTFDFYLNRFKIKDLSTTNGTYVNNALIPGEEYISLNHMDSIRLGHDTMMYHMEQGSQVNNAFAQLTDQHYVPSWAGQTQDTATAHLHNHALAECQGCIAEQKIQHTCNLMPDRKPIDGANLVDDMRHSTCCEQHQEEAREFQVAANPDSNVTHPSNDDHRHKSHQLYDQQNKYVDTSLRETTSMDVNNSLIDAAFVNCNTWPRRRQVKQTGHVGSVFQLNTSDIQDTQTDEAHPMGPVQTSEAHPAGPVQTMFFVTFDDSICSASNISSSADNKERQSSRNTSEHQTELATVKKGTPLYGQPSWWGEVEGDTISSSKAHGEKKGSNGNSRPTDLGLQRSTTKSETKDPRVSVTESQHVKPPCSSTYMEIPVRDDHYFGEVEKCKEVSTPAKSITSSLSKDSLSASPERRLPSKSIKTESPSMEVNSATSFTIDLDDPDHPPTKSLNISSSISEFVPSKIRRNFRERKALSSKTSSKESTPSKNSEERELSPLAQPKIDEVYNIVGEGGGKSWFSDMQRAVGTSLRSPNLEEIDRLSEFSEDRKSLEKDSSKRGSLKRLISSKSPQMSISSLVASSSSTGASSRSPASSVHLTNLSQYSDSTSYLIDKMFEGGNSVPVHADSQHSPDLKVYREVTSCDKNVASHRSAETTLVRPIIDDSTSSLHASAKSDKKTTPARKIQHHCNEVDDELRIIEDVLSNSIELQQKDDKDEITSEAGTYTIEADMTEGSEEEEARKRIDQVFGVDVENFNTEHPVIDPLRLASPGGYDNIYDFADGERTPLDESRQSPVDDGNTDLTVDDGNTDLTVDDGNTDLTVDDGYYRQNNEGVQMWMNQLSALTNQKSSDTNRAVKEEGEAFFLKKPPHGVSRKRPGTGRKLPTVPSDKSPVSSEHDSQSLDQDFINGDDVPIRRTPDQAASGRNSANSNSNSSQPHSRVISNGHIVSQNISSRSRGSVDTEVLLQDTETVMAAMQARISHKSNQIRKDSFSHEANTDASSTVALVNGDENYVKATQFRSPRDALMQRQKSDLLIKPSSTTSVSPGRKPVLRSYPQVITSKSSASPKNTPSSQRRKSDITSRRDSMDNDSIVSDISSDAGESRQSRSASKSKGAITMTRTNKTFDLRRARVDSFEEPGTPKSVKSSASSKSGASTYSVGRSHSLHSTTRNKSLASVSISEAASLGAQIVKKSQSNMSQESRRIGSAAIGQTDGGKLLHSKSLTTSHPAIGSTNNKRESTPKSQIRTTPTNKGNITVTGISNISNRSQSQPGSRSNSPKAAEKMAWKRRKEYDARKSVAEAKATKPKDNAAPAVTMRSKPSTSSSIKRRMIRSASYTNSAGLPLGIHSSQDFSERRDSYSQHEDFRRAFIPFQNSLRSDRSTHSADEDDSLVSANSTQTSYDSLIVASIYQLSLKLKTSTDKTLSRLREQNRVSHTPSPIDDFLSDSGKSEITAWKTANQELAGTLKNLRKLERHMHMMNAVIFTDVDIKGEVSSGVPTSRKVKQKLLEDIERKFGFQPINNPYLDESDLASPEMAEFSGQF